MYKSKRSKATSINNKTKQEIYNRDKRCILCGLQPNDAAHYISRANGGLGIKENLVCLCRSCHNALDQSPQRKELLARVKQYLDYHYPNFTDEERKYKK